MTMTHKVFALFVIMYMCCNQVSAGTKVVTCAHSVDFVKLRCGGGVIHIEEANYGRIKDFKTSCPINKPKRKECTARNSKEIVKGKCEGKSSCVVEPANSVFGDPCKGFTKYLFIEYTCGLKRTRVACEHAKRDHVVLRCPRRLKIYVIFANYGRNNKNSSCSNLNKPKVKFCTSKNSLGIVRGKCNGKASCRVRAANGVLGHPCPGVVKYLYVQYLCV